jgi:cytochrome c peroxidase
MMTRSKGLLGTIILAATSIAACSGPTSPDGVGAATSSIGIGADPVAAGDRKFHDHFPTGNGRACGTCHVEETADALTPEYVEAHFDALPRNADGSINFSPDPLFQSIDANDFAHDFTNLRRGLVRITLPLPANTILDNDPNIREVSMWRAVPSIHNVAITAPYLQDGRAATLDEQAHGAAEAHIQPTNMPAQAFFDLIIAYENAQFSSDRVRDLAQVLASGATNVPRADPPDLTANELAGRAAFNVKCAGCHGGPQLTSGPEQRPGSFKTIFVSEFNTAKLPLHRFTITLPNHTTVTKVSPDPGRFLITGQIADFNNFDTPTIYGIADTAPYFHDNSAPDLQAVMDHYQALFAILRMNPALAGMPALQAMSPEEEANIIAYMRRL